MYARASIWILVVSGLCYPAAGGDWPQILGPNRDGVAQGEATPQPWPEEGPPQVWSTPVGEGFAGPAVAGNQVLIFHRFGKEERLTAVAAQTGEVQWQQKFPATYSGGYNPDSGPRCVPLIHGGRVYLFGAAGDLRCLELETGQPRWSVDAYGKFAGDEGYFGVGSTPIVAGNRLIVNVGGRNAGIVAFDLENGEAVWKKTREGASYSSPTLAQIGGRTAVVFVTRLNAVALDPTNGNVLFQFPFGRKGPTVNAAVPLVVGDRLFVSASYGIGAKLARIRETGSEIVWENLSSMASQYTTCVHRAGFLYGTHGREDGPRGELRCLELATGEVRWKTRDVGVAHTILVNERLLVLNTEGELFLVEADPSAYRLLAQASLSGSTTRALPALANGLLYLRDSRTLRCFRLSPG